MAGRRVFCSGQVKSWIGREATSFSQCFFLHFLPSSQVLRPKLAGLDWTGGQREKAGFLWRLKLFNRVENIHGACLRTAKCMLVYVWQFSSYSWRVRRNHSIFCLECKRSLIFFLRIPFHSLYVCLFRGCIPPDTYLTSRWPMPSDTVKKQLNRS